MATLTKISPTVVSVSGISNGRQIRQRFSMKRHGAAYRKLAEELYEKLLTENIGSDYKTIKEKNTKRMTVRELADKYRKEHLDHTRAQRNYSYLELICSKFGDWHLHLITIAQVRPWIYDLMNGKYNKKQYSGSSTLKVCRYFQRIFNWGMEMDIVGSNPLDALIDMHLKKLFKRTTGGKKVFVTHEELMKKLSEIEAKNKTTKSKYNDTVAWMTNAARFAAYTGMRLGEIVAVKWCNVHSKLIYLDADATKEAAAKIVALEPECIALLDKIRDTSTSDYLFVGLDGSQLTTDRVSTSWKYWAKEVGLPITFHDIRHIYAKRKRLEGHDIKAIAAQMGHKSLAMNMVYDQATEEDLRRLVCSGTNGS